MFPFWLLSVFLCAYVPLFESFRNAWVAGSSPAVGSIEFAGQSLMRLAFFFLGEERFAAWGSDGAEVSPNRFII